jgi:uncharacterized membrane protein HdeD (DUF308 family)
LLLSPINDRTEFGQRDAEEVARAWPIFVLYGLFSLVFGVLILTVDWSVDSLSLFIGILFIVQGTGWLITRPLDGGSRETNIVAGLGSAVVGIALIAIPDKGLRTLGAFVGIWIVLSGLLHIAGAFANRHVPYWWLVLAFGLIEVPIGIGAMRRPGLTLALVVTFAGIWAIANGIWQCVLALEVRKDARRLRAAAAPRTAS